MSSKKASDAEATNPELMALMKGLSSTLLNALDEVSEGAAKVDAGSATAADKKALKKSAKIAKDSKAALVSAGPARLVDLKKLLAQEESARVMEMLMAAQETDLCFVLDGTASMGPLIEAVKSVIRMLVAELRASVPDLKLRLALVVYRDVKDSRQFEVTPFGSSVSDFERSLGAITATGGGDECEDVIGGLNEALQLDWRHTTRVLVLCGDAPCHGSQYHDGCGDDLPDGTGMSAGTVLNALRQQLIDTSNLSLPSFQRKVVTTDKMIRQFNAEVGGDEDYIASMRLDMHDLLGSVKASVFKAVSKSLERSAERASMAGGTFLPVVMDKLIDKAKSSVSDPVPEEVSAPPIGGGAGGGGGGGCGGLSDISSLASMRTMASVTAEVMTVEGLLKHAKLDKYAAVIEEEEYLELADLTEADEGDLMELAAKAAMSKPATGRFLRVVASAKKNAAG